MKAIRVYIKYLFICPLVIAFFIAAPVEAAESVKENTEEVEETKLYFKLTQSVKQKPKKSTELADPPRTVDAYLFTSLKGVCPQCPKYILYCNLIFYE